MGIAGLAAGIAWVNEQPRAPSITRRIRSHRNFAPNSIFPGFQILGHQDWSRKVATVSFTVEGLDPTS